MPGLTRVLRGKSFRFRKPNGSWVTDADEITRIRKLAIPPAYTDVWICPLHNGHLQGPPGWTHGAGASTVITPSGGACATKASSTVCVPLARHCRVSANV